MRRILMAVAGYVFMAWWNSRAASSESNGKKRTQRTKTPARKPQATRPRSQG